MTGLAEKLSEGGLDAKAVVALAQLVAAVGARRRQLVELTISALTDKLSEGGQNASSNSELALTLSKIGAGRVDVARILLSTGQAEELKDWGLFTLILGPKRKLKERAKRLGWQEMPTLPPERDPQRAGSWSSGPAKSRRRRWAATAP